MTRRHTSEEKPVKHATQRGGEILAPADFPAGSKLHAGDGRKLKDVDHVGAISPDADGDELPPQPKK